MRKPLPADALQNVTWTTPTGYAETAYQADRLKQNRDYPVGPAGVKIPPSLAIYRKVIDKGLLPQLFTKAYIAHCDRELPTGEHRAAAASIGRELARIYPVADMLVLERYGYTREIETIDLTLLTAGEVISHRVRLDAAILVPRAIDIGFHVDLGGKQPCHRPPAPADVDAYARTIVRLRADKDKLAWPGTWVDRFRTRHARWPKWTEIETAFPLLATFLAEQRAGIAATSNPKGPAA